MSSQESIPDSAVGYRSCPANPEAVLPLHYELPEKLALSKLESSPGDILPAKDSVLRDIKLYVKTQISVEFGKAVYLVGSCKELGSWSIAQATRLDWSEVHTPIMQGDYWRGCASLEIN